MGRQSVCPPIPEEIFPLFYTIEVVSHQWFRDPGEVEKDRGFLLVGAELEPLQCLLLFGSWEAIHIHESSLDESLVLKPM